METWTVNLNGKQTVIEANELSITQVGALVFTSAGVLNHVFAPGQWLEVVLTKQGQHGYS